MNPEINGSKALTKHKSCQCKCKFLGENLIQINGRVTINLDVSVKKVMYVKKIIFGILLHVVVNILSNI